MSVELLKRVFLRSRLGQENNLILLISVFLSSSRVSAMHPAFIIRVVHDMGLGLHEVMSCSIQLCLVVQIMTSGALVLWGKTHSSECPFCLLHMSCAWN